MNQTDKTPNLLNGTIWSLFFAHFPKLQVKLCFLISTISPFGFFL